MGQFTPGPVFTTATFIGYLLRGTGGAAVATIGIFLPSFLLVALTSRLPAWLIGGAALALTGFPRLNASWVIVAGALAGLLVRTWLP